MLCGILIAVLAGIVLWQNRALVRGLLVKVGVLKAPPTV